MNLSLNQSPVVVKKVLRWILPYNMYIVLSNYKQINNGIRNLNFSTLQKVKVSFYFHVVYFNSDFIIDINEKITIAKANGFTGGGVSLDEGCFLYALVRLLKPCRVLETGVGPGMSSLFFLKALNDNHLGSLISVDLPGYDEVYYPSINKHFDIHVPKDYDVGWLVPKALKTRWKLIEGDAKKVLPSLLTSCKFDFFFHDSLHTEDQMLFEYESLYSNMNKGGVIGSHDVDPYWSDVFVTFCSKKNLEYGMFKTSGISIKH